jgi:hypothetical protein
LEGRKRRCHVKGKKTEEDRKRGLISHIEEEDGKGHADILSLPTRKQFQVTADTRCESETHSLKHLRLQERLRLRCTRMPSGGPPGLGQSLWCTHGWRLLGGGRGHGPPPLPDGKDEHGRAEGE